jgi:hypothetical protein
MSASTMIAEWRPSTSSLPAKGWSWIGSLASGADPDPHGIAPAVTPEPSLATAPQPL